MPAFGMHVSVQAALLRRARDLAGGVSLLAKALQVSAYDLDDMLHAKAAIPTWLFLRAVDYVNDVEQAGLAGEKRSTQQLLEIFHGERLDQVLFATRRERAGAIFLLLVRGEREHPRIFQRGIFFDPSADFEAVEPG
jgi:hypothetical protein